MKYIAIIYGNKEMWESFPPDVAAKAIGEVNAFNKRHTASGELLGAYGLADELMAKTVRVRDGVPAVTDGPYLEAKEFVSSSSSSTSTVSSGRWRSRPSIPFASHNAVEVWPILHESGAEM